MFAALALGDQGAEVLLAETNALRRTAIKMKTCGVFDPISSPAADASFDLVVDAVGSKHSRTASVKAVKPGGVVMHVGLMDNDGGLDTRIITLQEITFIGTYKNTPVDFRVTAKKLDTGAFGTLDWYEQRPLSGGASAFSDLRARRCAAPKIILRP